MEKDIKPKSAYFGIGWVLVYNFKMDKKGRDVIVIGGGHAGIEAALAAARMGMSVLLLTFSKKRIGCLSCNPAVGGVGKGQLVREIDALGGETARAADASALQFRILNRSKGPAVWSSRAQVDAAEYALYMQQVVGRQPGIEVLEGEVTSILAGNNIAAGVEIDGKERVAGKTVVLAPGTFLNGTVHIGMESFNAGRLEDEKASKKLPENLKLMGFSLLRFKTGTCARLDGDTIDFSSLAPQYGDEPPSPFSLSTRELKIEQMACYITHTNERTHEIIRANLDSSPLFSGVIKGTGVRYCPSLEDKVVKFPHHKRHHVFLEPEGRETSLYYPNGISTSLPEHVQDEFIRTIKGLEKVSIKRYGYGIEHDVVEPTQVYPSMEAKRISGLFLAGQINGTTGYEEAAAQGLVAGVNASLKVKGLPPLVLDRTKGYMGVLIDDLTTRGTQEPYRMFTSRVEYRLMLREDNADLRLRETGCRLGLVSRQEWEKTKAKKENLAALIAELKKNKTVSNGKAETFFERLRKPGVTVKEMGMEEKYPDDVVSEAEIEARYAPYIERMLSEMKEFKNLEKVKIPPGTDYAKIPGISLEIREKLSGFKPLTLGQAGRISGVTPAALAVLAVYLKKGYRH